LLVVLEYLPLSPDELLLYLVEFLQKKGQKGKTWLWIAHLFHLHDDETHSDKLSSCIEEFVDGLMEIYRFIVKK